MVVASGEVRLPKFLRREAGAEVDRLYRRYADEVFRYALMVMRSRPDAEDISQIVFVRALRAIERGEKVRTPRNWLIKIAHNECRRLLSSRKVHAELPEEIAVEPVERADVTELRTAMAELPEAQRKALCLRELEGRTYVEIATELGLSVSAVETLIFRARRTLREQLEASISCEDFALLLDDPSARPRIRAHARTCPECATLERQARGRKGVLKRIASILGLPMWGTKLAAVGLTAAALVATTAPAAHHFQHHKSFPQGRNPLPQSGSGLLGSVPHRPVVARPAKQVSDTRRVSDTHAVAPVPTPVTTPPAPMPDPPAPGAPPLPPAAETPAASAPAPVPAPVALPTVAPPDVTVSTPAVTIPAPTVTVPPVDTTPVTVPSVTTPVATTPPVPVPAVTVPSNPVTVPVPTVPTVTIPVAVPNVSLP
jgi:RNA polymerase sigma factor (sigma-70 family)